MVQGREARWRFAAGGARVALFPRGRASLLQMTDDNFNATQRNQLVLLEIAGRSLPATGSGPDAAAGAPGERED
jgi:hypothetical protein